MKDERIRYRPAERAALVAHQVQAFCLTGGNLRAAVMAEQYIAVMSDLARPVRHRAPSSTPSRQADSVASTSDLNDTPHRFTASLPRPDGL
jgi:hypothetical protein